MKLKSKLIAAPLATALVALAAGLGYGIWAHFHGQSEREAQARSLAQYRSLAEARAQLATVHAGAYRVMAILNSLDESQVKAFSTTAGQQIDTLTASLAALAGQDAEGSDTRKRFDELATHLAAYRKQVSKAMEVSAIDANMGVAALKAVQAVHVRDDAAAGMTQPGKGSVPRGAG